MNIIGMMESRAIRFRTTRDPNSQVPVPTPASVHAVRQYARRTLVRLRALRPALGRSSFGCLRKSLLDLIDITAESRDAEVQRAIIARLKADDPKGDAVECNQLLRKLKSRRQVATAQLAEYFCSDVGTEQLRRLNKDLAALQVAGSTADLPRLAARRYRRALHGIARLLAHKIPTGRRLHPLRIRIRRARDLASLFDVPQGVRAQLLNDKLNKMQNALGDFRDSTLLVHWTEQHGVTISSHLRITLDIWTEHCLKRCRRRRKSLRRAIRQFLRKPRS